MKKNLEEYIKKYKSVRNWFLKPKPNGERRYERSTEKANLERLEFWCDQLNKNPDELVPSNFEEAHAIELKIMGKLLEQGVDKESEITQHTTKYHAFCHFNNFTFPYGGDRLKNIIRLEKWTPNTKERKLESSN